MGVTDKGWREVLPWLDLYTRTWSAWNSVIHRIGQLAGTLLNGEEDTAVETLGSVMSTVAS